MSNEQPYDVVVVGGGPGGYVAAIRAAQLGQRTAVIEREELGGICLNWGCIPSKALLRNAEVLTLVKHAQDFGITIGGEVTADYAAALQRCRGVINTQVKGVQFLMRKNKIDVIKGTARLTASDRLTVSGEGGDREVTAQQHHPGYRFSVRMLQGVAVDGKYVSPAVKSGMSEDLPHRIVIVGAGPIGLEFATVFMSYGCDVTVVEMLDRVIPLEDAEMSDLCHRAMTRRGLKVLTIPRWMVSIRKMAAWWCGSVPLAQRRKQTTAAATTGDRGRPFVVGCRLCAPYRRSGSGRNWA